jgi:hypothetical protein
VEVKISDKTLGFSKTFSVEIETLEKIQEILEKDLQQKREYQGGL